MNTAKRMKLLVENYVDARKSGKDSGYEIRQVNPDNYEHYYILIKPKAGVYKGHHYIMELKTSYGHGADIATYPINSPYAHFITNIFHVNISSNGGSICLDMLKDKSKWSPLNSFDTIVQNILLLFDEPNNASPYNGEASKCWVRCEKKYNFAVIIEEINLLQDNASSWSKLTTGEISELYRLTQKMSDADDQKQITDLYNKAIAKLTSDEKKELHRKISVQRMDELSATSFEPFSNEAVRIMKTNHYKQFGKWFPQLDPKHTDYETRVATDDAEFEEICSLFETMRSKKKIVVQESKADCQEPTINLEELKKITGQDVIQHELQSDDSIKPVVDVKIKSRWAKYQK